MFDFDFPIEEKTGANATNLSFEECMRDMFDSMCRVIASSVLRGIARYLKIEEDWFHEQYGPMDTSSQWHVKRYAEPDDAKILQDDQPNQESEPKEGVEWLPVHTDPSLISVVIHDAPGTNDNAMGLEYHALLLSPSSDTHKGRKKERVWKEVNKHGHAVATIFCGSVMSYITGGVFQSAKHRVMYRPMETKSNNVTTRGGKNYRQAATLFLRPQGDSILTVPPSDVFVDRVVKIKNCKFQDWLNRVSKNYQGGQIKKNTKKEKPKKKKKVNTVAVIKSDPMYWTDTYTELSLHRCQDGDLSGKEKCQENKLSELNNHIYTMAGFAHRILVMDVSLDPPKLELIGPDLQADFKWSCGIPIDNIVYGIPCHSESVLKINTLTKEINLLKWGENLPGACPHNQQWKYSSATVSNHDGCIYCIPQCAERVLKIDPKTDEMTFIGPAFPGVNKWSEGLLLNDGGIYGVCQNARGILRIDPETQQCTVNGEISEGHCKWHGAVKHTDGNIYCIPSNAEQVLKVEPGIEPKLTLLGEKKYTGTDHGTDYKTKYLGGTIGGDCVYFFPCDADYVCEVNTITGKVWHLFSLYK
jgi:isopenicillin N synthase-like dioxygenase